MEEKEKEKIVCVKCGIKSGMADWLTFHWEEGYVGHICNICKDGLDPLMLQIINLEIKKRLHNLGIKTNGCRRCNRFIFWVRTKNDKSAPVQLDLINHFATCPNAKDFKVENKKINKEK